jgi:DNA-binding GntR family transcriptional regulator
MPSSFSPQTRNAAVLDELRRRILHGTLKPGDRIMADAIAEEVGVSRIPVREALRVLEGERQVSYEPHRGYFVTELRFADLIELYLMRHLLEADALRRSVPKLDQEDFDRMQLAIQELEKAHKDGEIADHSIANRSFHFAFLEQLEMPRLLSEIKALYDQCDGYGSLFYNSARNRHTARRDHLALYHAAQKRDAEEVIRLLSEHRDHVVEALRRVFKDQNGAQFYPVAATTEAPSAAKKPAARARNTKRSPKS